MNLLQKIHKYPQIVNHVRMLCSINQSKSQTEATNYVTIYKFPYIRPFSVVNRLKVYQTAITGISVPCSLALQLMNVISIETFQLICGLGLSGCVTLYGLGFLTTRFIGFLYYDENRGMVKVAYVDFWGKRKDIEIPQSDIIPIEELPISPTDGLFLKFKRYSSSDILRLNLKFGIVIDKDKIKKVL